MSDDFKIYLDRLKDEHPLKVQGKVSPDFIQVNEKDLSFPDEVHFSGETYLSNGFFILHLKIETSALIPCLICNEKIKFPIIVNDFYLSEKISELKSVIFDFKDELRSSIITKVPSYFECHEGKCPERESIKKYLKQESC
ncbi:MAG TPA: hypothetical protein VLF61_01160 [Rhabdochlamydiaceae bacterium]|nr:hypothetical protein [Rhabdochlamydiaceae bacterium]